MENGGLIDKSREVRAKSFDEDILFSLLFYLIYLSYARVDVCKNNQGIANKEKTNGADKSDKSIIGIKKIDKAYILNISRVDIKKADGTNGLNISKVDAEKTNKADGIDTNRKYAEKTNRMDVSNISKADIEKANGADISNIGRANVKKVWNPGTAMDRANVEKVDKANIGKAEEAEDLSTIIENFSIKDNSQRLVVAGQMAVIQMATRFSFFSFCKVFFLSFFLNWIPTAFSHLHLYFW